MVVADVVREKPEQVALIERDNVVEQVTSAAPNPALRDAFLLRGPKGSAFWRDRHGADRCKDVRSILGIAIQDENTGSRVIREGFSKLVHDPAARGVVGDVEVQHSAAVVSDDEEAVDNPEAAGGNGEESIAAIASRWLSRKVSQDLAWPGSWGAFRIQREMVLSETSKPSLRSSPWIRGAPQERFSRTIHRAQNRRAKHPEELVGRGKSRPWMPSLERRELLPQHQVLEQKTATPTDQPGQCAAKKLDEADHPALLSPFAFDWNPVSRWTRRRTE
jgi:hypothetical protein